MSGTMRLILALAALAVVGTAGYVTVNRVYLQPRAELLERIESASEELNQRRQALEDKPNVQSELRRVVQRTLGGDQETVDHQLRTRLNRLAEAVPIRGAVVNTGRAVPRQSPARRAFRGAMRDELDFVELEASVAGQGTLEQALMLLDVLDAEPWLKHITQVTLDPKDNGGLFDINVRLTTIYMPGRSPEQAPGRVDPSARGERFASLVSLNPFRIPSKPEPKPEKRPDPKPQRTEPPAFRYDHWTVTAVIAHGEMEEVWLRNQSSNQSKRLTIGDQLHDMKLVATRGEFAEFERSEQRFRVRLGQTLADRETVKR